MKATRRGTGRTNVLIVGGGFAGVWSALSASAARAEAGVDRRQLTITLLSPRDELVIRPRLYEPTPAKMTVPLPDVLAPVAVERITAAATSIDTAERVVTAITPAGAVATIAYDRLILASGSQIVPAPLPGSEFLHNVDTLEAAVALDEHLHRVAAERGGARLTGVVVGAGFTGIEVATTLVDRLRGLAGSSRGVRVVLVERGHVVGPDLGPGPRPVIEQALASLDIECRLATTLLAVDRDRAWLSDGTEIEARTVVWTAGLKASALTRQVATRLDARGRLDVDAHLRVSAAPEVFGAGDTAAPHADPTHRVLQSCQHAIPQGMCAGANAVADICGAPLTAFAPRPYVTCLDLGSAGAVYTTGWDRAVELTGAAAKARKRQINEKWIYPPIPAPGTASRGSPRSE